MNETSISKVWRASAILAGTISSLAAFNSAGGASTVAISFDEQCLSCATVAQPGVPILAYVVLSDWSHTGHCLGCGLGEINFKLNGIPSDWGRSYAASQLASFASDPFALAGATIQFNPLLAEVPDCLILYTLTLVPSTTTSAKLDVGEHLWKNCDLGGPSPIPMPHGPAVVECHIGGGLLCVITCDPGGHANTNGTPCRVTATGQELWGSVKSLYR